MLEEFRTASRLLCAALDRYVHACFALDSDLSYKHVINKVTELSDIMDNEMNLVESYRSKLTQAQVAVKRARNNQAHVPINSLPPEVLTQVFHLLVLDEAKEKHNFPRYPDILSHVCSRWRQIALGSPQLWARIDIVLSCPRSKGFHDRAAVHASRARQVPLDIHLIDPGYIVRPETSIGSDNASEEEDAAFERWNEAIWEINPDMSRFLASPDSPIRSLGLVVTDKYHPIHSRALEHSLANCLPGGLTELVICIGIPLDDDFFQVQAKLEDWDTTELVLSKQWLDHVLHSITLLDLKGMYFPWTSTAYHGLTVLRLLGGKQISVSELAGILTSSPGLHTIQCDFTITDSPGSSTPNTVALRELEMLELGRMTEEDVERFMQLLNPGPKPLRLSFYGNLTPATLQAFYARSNVQELRVVGGSCLPFDPFCLPPQLRVLIINNWSSFTKDGGTTPPIQLETVYMLGCHYKRGRLFRKTVARFSPRRLVLWKCSVEKSGNRTNSLPAFKSALKDDSGLCSMEYLTDQDPNPVPDWQYYYW